MKIRDLMHSPVHSCHPQDSLESAAQKLWDYDCGVLPVVDREGLAGAVITDRDICMAAYTQGGCLADLRVADSMSEGLVCCAPDDDLSVAVERMTEHQLHRLPVVDEQGKPCGLLSLSDLARASEQDAGVGRDAMSVLRATCRLREHEDVRASEPAPTRAKAAKPGPKAQKATK